MKKLYFILFVFFGGMVEEIWSAENAEPSASHSYHFEPFLKQAYTRGGVSLKLASIEEEKKEYKEVGFDPSANQLIDNETNKVIFGSPIRENNLKITYYIWSGENMVGAIQAVLSFPENLKPPFKALFNIRRIEICKEYQRKGYGSKAIEGLFAGLKTEPFFIKNKTLLKLYYSSPWLGPFYRRFGFRDPNSFFTTNNDWDKILVADLDKMILPIERTKAAVILQKAWRAHKAYMRSKQ